jgi:hypothetical protein
MELYTLTRGFFPKEFISEFTSLIWTERYSSAGDVQLVVDPIPSTVAALAPGTLLGLRGVKEIMMVENQSIENGLLTVTGSSLVKFLNQREAWFPNPAYDGTDTTVNLSADYSATETIGQFLADVVNMTVINPIAFTSYWAPINIDWANDKIPGLALGRIDPNGAAKLLSFPLGPIYDGLTQLAAGEAEGFKLYLESAQYSTSTYVLRFATYRGKDRTRDQTANLMVRFAPQLDSLTNVKEISSFSEYKNTVYVFYKNQVSVHYIPTLTDTPHGFDRRAIMVDAPDIYLDPPHIPPFLDQVARDALANHLYIQAVDGQVSSKNDYVFERDYYLGDIIELEGFSGLISKARVTEYIRSQDQFGEQEYPTLSVIDPLGTNYIPDTEPTDYTPDWVGEDPNWTDDWTMPDVSVPPDVTVNPLDPRLTRTPPLDNPLDPYNFNTDPIPYFGSFDDGSGLGGGGDGGGDGGGGDGSGSDVGLTPLGAMKVANWFYNSDTGYYVHQGRVCIIGAANADGGTYLGSTLLLINIPAEFRPASPVSRRVLVDHVNSSWEYAYDSGLHIGPWLDVTVNPDGTVTLDGGNPFHAVGASTDYMNLTLILSSITWPTTFASLDTYSPSGSLTDYVSTSARILAELGDAVASDAWANVDGHYSVHNGRFHLDGNVKVASALGELYDPLIGIPFANQPKQATSGVCEVPQKDGYRFAIRPRGEGSPHHALSVYGGAQNPQAAGNGGCGVFKEVFYQRYGNGYLARGSSPSLSFTPGFADSGLSFVGASGNPIGGFPSAADWRGNAYSASVRIKLADIMSVSRVAGFPVDLTDVTGPAQFCFVMGIAPGIGAYYKVVFTYDSALDILSIRLILEGSGSAARYQLGENAFTPHPASDGIVGMTVSVSISSNPTDVAYEGLPLVGNYYSLNGLPSATGSDFVGGMPTLIPAPGGKGDMGFHIPSGSSAEITSAEVVGVGHFPKFVTNDTIDFTGCGWPLT